MSRLSLDPCWCCLETLKLILFETFLMSRVLASLAYTPVRRQPRQHGQMSIEPEQPRVIELVQIPGHPDDRRRPLLPSW
jgi:hypothetical protein